MNSRKYAGKSLYSFLFGACLISSGASALAPTLEVQFPEPSGIFQPGNLINFSATSSDPEQGDISERIQWQSTIDGDLFLGTSGQLELSPGEHGIVISVTDDESNTITITRRVVVQGVPYELIYLNAGGINDFSSDGSYAAACVYSGQTCGKGAMWLGPSNQLIEVGDMGQKKGNALAVDDAGITVGWAENESTYNVPVVGSSALPLLTDFSASGQAVDVSPDGSVIVGYSRNSLSDFHPVRWVLENDLWVVESLGVLSGDHAYSYATAVSDDGSVIVGYGGGASSLPQRYYAFRWTELSGLQSLGSLSGGSDHSEAHAVSPDGHFIAGLASTDNGMEFFRWQESTGMEALGVVPGDAFFTDVVSINSQGNEITFNNGYVWTENIGLRTYQQIFEELYGMDETVASDLTVKAISADANVLGGKSVAHNAFIFRKLNDQNHFPENWSVPLAKKATKLTSQGADGTLYIVSDDLLSAFSPQGLQLWQYDAGGQIQYSPAVDNDGNAHLIVANQHLVKVGPDGQELWRYTHSSGLGRDPALGNDGNVYVGSGDGRIYAINVSGQLAWSYNTGYPILSSVSVDQNNNLYLFSYYKKSLISIDSKGSTRWTLAMAGREPYKSPSIAPNGNIFVFFSKSVVSVTPAGEIAWTYTDPELEIRTAPVFDGFGNIYVGADYNFGRDNYVIVLDSDGSRFRDYPVTAYVDYAPTVSSNNSLIVSDRSGRLFLFAPNGDKLVEHWGRLGLWSVSQEGSIILAGDALQSLQAPDVEVSTDVWSMASASGQRTRNAAYLPVIDLPPSVAIESPVDGAIISEDVGAIAFTALASDPEDGELTDILWSSSLDGAFVPPVALSVGVHTITATVNDSQNKVGEDSITVEIQAHVNQSPNIMIESPEADSEFTTSDSIRLIGTASDLEDGDLSAMLEWSSDRDGILGEGGELNVTLSEGDHIITATVKDSELLAAQENVSIRVIQEKFADMALAFKGQTGKYQNGFIHFDATVTNNGPDSASNVLLTVNLPSQAQFSSVDPEIGCTAQTQSVFCQIDSLNTGEQISYRVSVTTADKNLKMDFTGTVAADEQDTDVENNSVTKQFGGALYWILLPILGLVIARRKAL